MVLLLLRGQSRFAGLGSYTPIPENPTHFPTYCSVDYLETSDHRKYMLRPSSVHNTRNQKRVFVRTIWTIVITRIVTGVTCFRFTVSRASWRKSMYSYNRAGCIRTGHRNIPNTRSIFCANGFNNLHRYFRSSGFL